MIKRMQGITLVELVVFIVIIGLAGAAIVPLTNSLSLGSNQTDQLRALQLARARMELILASKHLNGFNNFTDPCLDASPPSICTLPSGFSIATPTISSGWSGSNEYKQITVTISGKSNAQLKSMVANTA